MSGLNIIVYALVPLFWLAMLIFIPFALPPSTFRDKKNQKLVWFVYVAIFLLLVDAVFWSLPKISDSLQHTPIYSSSFAQLIAPLRNPWADQLSRFFVLISGVLIFIFLSRSGQLILRAITNLRTAKSQAEKANEQLKEANYDLEAISQKIEALVDFGKELNTKIYAGENAIQDFIQEKADSFMNTENMYIAIYDQAKNEVNFPLFYKNGLRSKIPSRTFGDGRTEAIIETGDSILIHNKEESHAWYQQPGRKEYIGDELSSWIGVPMKDNEGNVIGVVATYHPVENDLYDQDDLRVLESMADLAVIAIENARLVERLKTVQTEIAERERESVTSGFAMDFTHKINNLVGPMKPWVQLLHRRMSDESKNNERVKKILKRIEQDISLILNEAKQLRQPMTDPEPIDLESLIMAILGQVELMANENVSIHFKKEADLPDIIGIRQQLSAAIYSIIQNGLKALKNGGDLTVTIDQGTIDEEKFAKIIVRDNGVGIDEAKRELIFEFGITFWKHLKGTGYGLWRAKNVIQNYGGRLDLTYTEIGKGTEFTIMLPFESKVFTP